MPHRIEQLRSTIDELERELESIDNLDEGTRSLLEEAAKEIQSALHPDDLEHHSLMERLQEANRDFTIAHPSLAAIVNKVVDTLGQFGI